MGGLGGAMGRQRDIVRLAGSAPKSDLGLDGSDRCRTSVVGCGILMLFYGYFSDFLYLNFCNLENPRNLSNSRAREIEPLRKSRELANIASEPQSAAFGIPVGSKPSFGGARSGNRGFVG